MLIDETDWEEAEMAKSVAREKDEMKRVSTGKTHEHDVLATAPLMGKPHDRPLDHYTLGYMAAMTDVLAILHDRVEHGPAGESGAIRETRDHIVAHMMAMHAEAEEKAVHDAKMAHPHHSRHMVHHEDAPIVHSEALPGEELPSV